VHPHFARNVAEHHMTVFQLYSKCCIGEILQNLTLHLNNVFFRHRRLTIDLTHWQARTLEVSLFEQTLILVRHDVGLNLRHEIHRYNHNNQQ